MQLPVQKRTFLPYLRGVPPEALRLGSLYLNPLEPNDGLASKRFEFRIDKDQEEYESYVKKWTWKEELDRPFSIEFETLQAESFGLTFSDILRISGERNKSVLVTIEGESGRRLKIRNPEGFLEEVMQQDGVERWLRTHASITHKGRFGRNRWKSPEIWMVTGVQHVTGGEIHFEGSASKGVSGKAGGDLGIATGTAPPGALRFSGEASHERSNAARNDFGHKDERIWAAQFMPVTIEFGPQEDVELTSQKNKVLPKTIRQFGLQDVPDLKARGIRASRERSSSPNGPVPELIGRVTAQPSEHISMDASDEDREGIVIDDTRYVSSVHNADWEKYDEYKKYLSKTEVTDDTSRSKA